MSELPYGALLISLGIGLLIGLERGWKDRSDPDGSRVAGFRTIGLIGFLGGLSAYVDPGSGIFLAAGFFGVALLLREGFQAQIDETNEVSVTTMIAALIAYILGAIAVLLNAQVAAAGAVVTTLVLWIKTPLHAALARIEKSELSALLYWLLITIVVLPVLPDQSYGPYGAFNPRTVWWMVVLISGLGFVGYLGMKLFGRRRGLSLLALMGGLVSSTAATMPIARLSRDDPNSTGSLVGATAIAWAMMIVRTFILIGIFTPALLALIAIPLGAMGLVAMLSAARGFFSPAFSGPGELSLPNPLDLGSALIFAALLTIALFVSRASTALYGDLGLYFIAVVAGAADIDAITLSVTQLIGEALENETAANAIVIAAMANSVLKGLVAASIGHGTYRRSVIIVAILMIMAGGIGLIIQYI